MRLTARYYADGAVHKRDLDLDVREVVAAVAFVPLFHALSRIYDETGHSAKYLEMTEAEWKTIRATTTWARARAFLGATGETAEIEDFCGLLGITHYLIREETPQ